MCAVCWTGAQIIPVSAVAGRYVWVNHLRYRWGSGDDPAPEAEPTEAQAEAEAQVDQQVPV